MSMGRCFLDGGIREPTRDFGCFESYREMAPRKFALLGVPLQDNLPQWDQIMQ